MRGETGGGMSRRFSDAPESGAGGGSSGVRGKVGGLGTALKPGFALLTGVEGSPATFSLGLEFQPDSSVQLGVVVQVGGIAG